MSKTFSAESLILAGIVGEIAFELYAWLLSPLLFGVALAPANLVVALVKLGTDMTIPYWAGFGLHILIGAIAFPTVVWLVAALTRTGLIISGAFSGLGLWFVAQGLLAPVIGRSFMMDFGAYTQSSFIGHVGMAMIIGYFLKSVESRI
ncbi:hypothetical protein [Albirhodobacter sp. R86504]|uniref:hypothetical protein n=1 Tax=Albirhodobacter sp. R86504 TaxID=3093848 RepID=UPI003671B14F